MTLPNPNHLFLNCPQLKSVIPLNHLHKVFRAFSTSKELLDVAVDCGQKGRIFVFLETNHGEGMEQSP